MNIEGKTIILTGARRIGQSVAEELAKKGANLAITYRSSKEESETMCQACIATGVKAAPFMADLSKESDIKRVVAEILEKFGKINGLVHMAANYPKTPWDSLTEEAFNTTFDVISKSTFLLGKIVGDALLKNNAENNIKGKMVFFSDWAANRAPYKDYSPYLAAKGSVETFTKVFAVELAPNITVNCIAPGPIWRPPDLTAEEDKEVAAHTLLKPWPGPEEISKAVLYFIDADFVTGVILPVDGGRSIA